jgi:hypothetical protein
MRMSSTATDVHAAIKTIDRQLDEGRRFRRIARVVKPSTPAALTKLEIVTTQSHLHPWTGQVVESKTVKLVDTRRALEEAIIARNKHHFAQADGTPFTRTPLSRIGSSNGYSLCHDDEGRPIHVPEDSFVETHTVMELLRDRQRDQIVQWSDLISFEEFIAGFLHWNEQTSTSPSGRHLGLYGALVTAYCNSNGDKSHHRNSLRTLRNVSPSRLSTAKSVPVRPTRRRMPRCVDIQGTPQPNVVADPHTNGPVRKRRNSVFRLGGDKVRARVLSNNNKCLLIYRW